MNSNQQRPALRLCPLALALGLAFGSAGASAQVVVSAPWYGNADMTPYSTDFIEAGMGYVGDGNAYFGKWSGLTESGLKPVGSLRMSDQGASGNYWSLAGYNLGLDSAMMDFEAGKQGAWWVRGGFQGLTRAYADDAILAWTPGIDQVKTPTVADVDLRRTTYDLGAGVRFLGNWTSFVDFQRLNRSGNQLAGSYRGSSAYHSSMMPVDDMTNRMTLGAQYTADAFQAEVAYKFSRYSNKIGSSYSLAGDLLGVTPDNDWNQVSAKLGYSFSPRTRLMGTVGYNWVTQDAAFAPVAGATIKTLGDGRTVNSLDGKVATTLADLTFVTRFGKDLGLRANYNYKDRDNKTASYDYTYTLGSLHTGKTLATSSTENRFSVEGDYALARRTKLRAWYTYQDTEYRHNYGATHKVTDLVTNRDGTIRDDLQKSQVGLEFRSRASDIVTGSLRYQFDKQSGGDYEGRADTIVNGATDNAVTLRQYWISDFDQNRVRGSVNVQASERVAVQFSADWRDRDYNGETCGGWYEDQIMGNNTYDKTCLGLTSSTRQAYTVDTQWMASDALQLFAFYSFGKQAQEQNGNTDGNLSSTTNKRWSLSTDMTDHTVGLGGNWTLSERLAVGGQVALVRGVERYSHVSYDALKPAVALPENDFTENTLQLHGTWKQSKDASIRLQYVYSGVRSADWAYDSPGLSPNYTNGLTAPDYNSHLVYLAVNLRFK